MSKTMAEVLHQHQDSQAANGGRYCICGGWEGPWTGNGFAAHIAEALSAAGFGLVAGTKAEALEEAADEYRHYETPNARLYLRARAATLRSDS